MNGVPALNFNVPRRRRTERPNLKLLLRNIPAYATRKKLQAYFVREFRRAPNISFIHLKDRTYTRSCLLSTRNVRATRLILGRGFYIFEGFRLTVEEYRGVQHHSDLYKRGQFKLHVTGYRNRIACTFYRRLEFIFKNCPHTGIQLIRDDQDRFTGVAEIRFITYAALKEARQIAIGQNWHATPGRFGIKFQRGQWGRLELD